MCLCFLLSFLRKVWQVTGFMYLVAILEQKAMLFTIPTNSQHHHIQLMTFQSITQVNMILQHQDHTRLRFMLLHPKLVLSHNGQLTALSHYHLQMLYNTDHNSFLAFSTIQMQIILNVFGFLAVKNRTRQKIVVCFAST